MKYVAKLTRIVLTFLVTSQLIFAFTPVNADSLASHSPSVAEQTTSKEQH